MKGVIRVVDVHGDALPEYRLAYRKCAMSVGDVALLRGTMSEAELHVLRGRLEGGKLNKARRGELRTPLPVGLLHDSEGRIVLDPDREVQAAVRCVFHTFATAGSAWMTVCRLSQSQTRLPVRVRTGKDAPVRSFRSRPEALEWLA
ncbi:MAG: hypothetical protein K8U57_06865 [Planctomycetes bacterium]|nr:hypothetical protein [Planctomycetota bacterium]